MIRTIKSRYFLCLSIFCFCFTVTNGLCEDAFTGSPWKLLDLGETALEDGEPGDALVWCDKAREAHRTKIEHQIGVLSHALLPSEVRKAGDDLQSVYDVLSSRNETTVLAVLDEIYLIHPPAYFGRSVETLRQWLEKKRVYPEADVLTGKIYQAEGENDQAKLFYLKAWENRAVFDIPDQRFDLSYRLADLSKSTGDYAAQENYLLAVLLEDPVFGKPGEESPTLRAMLNTLLADKTGEKFFKLYRHDNFVGLKAYQDLGSFYFYESRMRLDRALPVTAMACIIALTRITQALEQENFDYVYSGLPDAMVRAGKSTSIAAWATNHEVWSSFLLLGKILYEHGDRIPAKDLWSSLASYCPETGIAKAANKLLDSK